MYRTQALNLHAYAHDIASGTRPITGIRWYSPVDGTRLFPVPVLPEALHSALCPAVTCILDDDDQGIIVCSKCKVAVEQDAA